MHIYMTSVCIGVGADGPSRYITSLRANRFVKARNIFPAVCLPPYYQYGTSIVYGYLLMIPYVIRLG